MHTKRDELWLQLSADIDADDPAQVDTMRAAIEIAEERDSAATVGMIRRLYYAMQEDGL